MAKKVTKVRKTRKKSEKVKDSQKPWKTSMPHLPGWVSAALLGAFFAILIAVGIATS